MMHAEWPLIFVGGFLGSAHCIGMCGGFALSIGMGSSGPASNLRRQLVYSLGRISTYSFLGLTAGFAGFYFSRKLGALISLSAWLSIAAGALLVIQGLRSLDLIPRIKLPRFFRPTPPPCLAVPAFRSFLLSKRMADVFLAGSLTGFLPCGLVYGYLALATSSTSMLGGLATMLAFGLGTLPLMILTGLGASMLPLSWRTNLLKLAATCVLITGLLALGRGVHFLGALSHPDSTPSCPMCAERDAGPR